MADDCSSKVIDDVKHATPWLEFRSLIYLDPTGATRRWDMVGRATRSESAKSKGIDAVCVFATLRKKGEEDITCSCGKDCDERRDDRAPGRAGRRGRDPRRRAARVEGGDGMLGTVAVDEATAGRASSGEDWAARVGVPAMSWRCRCAGLSNDRRAGCATSTSTRRRTRTRGSSWREASDHRVEGADRCNADTARGYNVFAGLYTMALGMEMGEGR